MHSRRPLISRSWYALVAILVLATEAIPLSAAQVGTIMGRVMVKGSEPAAGATVVVLGTHRGVTADAEGRFTIANVPPGMHTVRAMLLGHDAASRSVSVNAGRVSNVTLELGGERVFHVPEIEVRSSRDLRHSGTSYERSGDEIANIPVDDVIAAMALMPGVVNTAGGFHLRGGRDGEVELQLDGVRITDPLFGRMTSIPILSVAEASLRSGGMDAEFGGKLSGVIDLRTREGGQKFGGEVQWHTDRYGESVKTFNNYDRFTFGFGGPSPVRGLTYYATYEGTWSDTYLKSRRTQPRRDVFDFIKLGNRQFNDVNSSAKLAYVVGDSKLTLEGVNNRSVRTPYHHMWSRQGYVSVTYDTSETATGPVVTPKYGRWSFFADDSTYVPYNAADHTPTTESTFRQLKAVWTHSLNKNEVYTVRLARNVFHDQERVQDKQPWEYDVRSPFYWAGNEDDNSFYVTHGDFPRFADRRSVVTSLKADYLTKRWKRHIAKVGIEAAYNEFHNLLLLFPNQESRGLPGLNRSDYVNYNPEGSAFLQDRWDFEGLVLNAGIRFDLFTPGDQISDRDLVDPQTGQPGRRYKTQFSPRLGIAYPISERDVLSFHYGWTFQTPARNFVFENRETQASVAVRGNPDLEPETNIAYQAGVQHLFSKDVSGQFSVFFKDIFGLIATRQVNDQLTNLLVPVWVNQDYASARGFEASIVKRFSHKFSGEVNYTYSIATGVASDPNQGLQFANGNLLYLPISERALDWDQRHTLSASFVLRDPAKWGVNMLWTYGSGLPYTPSFRNDRRPDPKLENSRRLPSTSTLSVVGDIFANIWGQRVTFFVDARNVLDVQNINELSFATFPNQFVNQVGDDYLIYFTETGRPGGAFLKDTNGDGDEDWVPVNDPRVWQEGRNVRVGVGVSF